MKVKKIKRVWDEVLFWAKREMSLTLIFCFVGLPGLYPMVVPQITGHGIN